MHSTVACVSRIASARLSSDVGVRSRRDGRVEQAAILDGQFVICRHVGGRYDGSEHVLDLREPDALLDELTARFSPDRIQRR